VLSWAQHTKPMVIREMLLLHEPDVFLLMGSAIVVAAIGCRVLRATGIRAFVSGEPIQWKVQPVQRRHVVGSAVFGGAWSVAATCPGPAAAMIGEGKLGGLAVVAGILAGVLIQQMFVHRPARDPGQVERTAVVGL
jgi:uncharacterized membrane protein YedE/YeeE